MRRKRSRSCGIVDSSQQNEGKLAGACAQGRATGEVSGDIKSDNRENEEIPKQPERTGESQYEE